jgi:hypothetical protein
MSESVISLGPDEADYDRLLCRTRAPSASPAPAQLSEGTRRDLEELKLPPALRNSPQNQARTGPLCVRCADREISGVFFGLPPVACSFCEALRRQTD